MSICDLPVDLVMEIVCRVPLRCMRAVRLTCKKWYTLSKSASFRKMQMRNEAARKKGESRMVALMDYNIHLTSVVVDDVEHPTTEIIGTLRCLDQPQLKIIKVFNYEGLLLCVLKDSFRIVVWNPYTGQTKWIEPPSYSCRLPNGEDRYKYSLGYDHHNKSHKILRFIDCYAIYKERGLDFIYEIYDFESNLWRTLDVGTPHWIITCFTSSVPLNGNTYFLARPRNSIIQTYDSLVCFDFTIERFGPLLPLPLPLVAVAVDHPRLTYPSISRLQGDKFALLLQLGAVWETEIWVTTVIDPTKVSWTKFLTVDSKPFASMAFSDMGFFIDEEKKVGVICDRMDGTRHTLNIVGEAGFLREVDFPVDRPLPVRLEYLPMCSHYTPSLVQLQKPPLRVYKRRKQPSKFQLRPCKSRLDDEEHSPKRTSLVQIQKPPLRVYKRRKQPSKFQLRLCKSRLDDEEPSAKRTKR